MFALYLDFAGKPQGIVPFYCILQGCGLCCGHLSHAKLRETVIWGLEDGKVKNNSFPVFVSIPDLYLLVFLS